MNLEEEISEFIHRRFDSNCRWLDGNCYYFALILKDRFGGEIYYDIIYGHFMLRIDDDFYDWTGKTTPMGEILVPWDDFEQYDEAQKQVIIRDCLK